MPQGLDDTGHSELQSTMRQLSHHQADCTKLEQCAKTLVLHVEKHDNTEGDCAFFLRAGPGGRGGLQGDGVAVPAPAMRCPPTGSCSKRGGSAPWRAHHCCSSALGSRVSCTGSGRSAHSGVLHCRCWLITTSQGPAWLCTRSRRHSAPARADNTLLDASLHRLHAHSRPEWHNLTL